MLRMQRTILLTYKHKTHSVDSDGRIVSNADINFYINNVVDLSVSSWEDDKRTTRFSSPRTAARIRGRVRDSELNESVNRWSRIVDNHSLDTHWNLLRDLAGNLVRDMMC
ncbi:unnamed protein product [Thlaspi arvense]|uniref:Uncharacterized protein n=1 Tax=Thlaspi arvense TaxID=13288 RepID=A0AAU9RR14_THLAR|nr:unnamed protein product [Thlaspi arvense]